METWLIVFGMIVLIIGFGYRFGMMCIAMCVQPPWTSSRHCLFYSFATLFWGSIMAGMLFAMFYNLPRPAFSVSSLEISAFNLTSDSILTTDMNLTISAINPNKNIIFFYDPFSVSVTTPVAHGVKIGNGSIPFFVQWENGAVFLNVAINGENQLDEKKASVLRKYMDDDKNIIGVPLEINFRSQVSSKIGQVKGPKTDVKILCKGISAVTSPAGGMEKMAVISSPKCKVDMLIKPSDDVSW